ncbi:MAG: hypothetical protein Gaeavirus5_5 [Gaeavirus sp.]|uniref:Uncharacterized protein n=1 Tax=Gaeavirus sp. TaxID=2487767 RepID=A0A3G4ZYM2_9VIRU|nr:MAG: hypothetical protein Gaeavirus5_5 [Gaeavirus sp.]
MSNPNINFLASAFASGSSTISGLTAVNPSTAGTQADCNIFPVGTTIDSSATIYDNVTCLMVNSTVNQTSNTVQAQYFDPVSGAPPGGFSTWNFDLTNTSYLNASFCTSSLLSENTSLFNNLQPNAALNGTGLHNLDITNFTTKSGTSPPLGLFFSLTSQPYYSNTGLLVPAPPTINNVNPGYSNYNSDNFIFCSNYYVQQKNEIVIVELLFTVSNTSTLNYDSTTGSPAVSVIVKNKIITKEALASLSSGIEDFRNIKNYVSGPIPLQYIASGATFNSKVACNFNQNNIPLIIAPGYTKLYVTMPLIYIPALAFGGNGQYFPQANYTFTGTPSTPTVLLTSLMAVTSSVVQYGYFIVGIAYSVDYNTYLNYSTITAEVLIKNIWRSPVAIYNSYNQYSVNDMATKQVVLLFGRGFNGGTFLVTNTGTPISAVNNYAVTSLRNFVSIMRAIINLFDGSVSLVDYFININTVQQVNATGSYNINVLILQALTDGMISNPPALIATNPQMNFLLLNSLNTAKFTIDPNEQSVFGQMTGFNYLGLQNSTLCSMGDLKYQNVNLQMISDSQGDLFGNSLSLGLNMVGAGQYYVMIILPEAQFAPIINPSLPNLLTLYATPNSLFYIMVTANSSSQFVPGANTAIGAAPTRTTTSTTTAAVTTQPIYTVNKMILSVSNTSVF